MNPFRRLVRTRNRALTKDFTTTTTTRTQTTRASSRIAENDEQEEGILIIQNRQQQQKNDVNQLNGHHGQQNDVLDTAIMNITSSTCDNQK